MRMRPSWRRGAVLSGARRAACASVGTYVLQVLDQVRQVLLAIEKLESMRHER
jgi:hypothetical protein